MKKAGIRLAIAALVCAFFLFASWGFAHLAVEENAAGALLSPGGLTDLSPLAIAAAFALSRSCGALLLCVLASLAAYEIVSLLSRRG